MAKLSLYLILVKFMDKWWLVGDVCWGWGNFPSSLVPPIPTESWVSMVHLLKFAIQVEKARTLTSDVAAVPYGETTCPPWPWLTLTF